MCYPAIVVIELNIFYIRKRKALWVNYWI